MGMDVNFLLPHSPRGRGVGVGVWAAGRDGEGSGREGRKGALRGPKPERRETGWGKRPPRCALGTGTGGVRLEVGVQTRCCLNGVFVWSGSGRRLRWGEAAPHLAPPLPEGRCVRSSSFVDD